MAIFIFSGKASYKSIIILASGKQGIPCASADLRDVEILTKGPPCKFEIDALPSRCTVPESHGVTINGMVFLLYHEHNLIYITWKS